MKGLTLKILGAFVTFIFVLMPLSAQAGWYNTSWKYRKTITIDNTKVQATLSNFPVLINRTDTDLRDEAQNDGDDILFTSSNGTTKLSHEIESFDGSTGALIAWVKVTSLSSSSDTVIYMYYGNSGASSQQDAANVWDSSFKMVQHLNEDPGDPSPEFKDSTSNDNDGSDNATSSTTGKIGDGIYFDGSYDWIQVPHSSSLVISGNQVTLSAWIKSTVNQNDDCGIVVKSDGNNYNMQLGVQGSDQPNFRIRTNGSTTYMTGPTVIPQNQWYFLYGIYNGSTLKVYLNTTEDATANRTGNVDSPTAPVVLGRRAIGDNRFFQGVIDEARVAYTARSTGWMNTEYNNQNSPSTFYSVGAETPVIQFTTTSSSGSEATISVDLELSLSGSTGQNVSVDYSVTGGTATGGGTDYLLASGTATITSGNTTTNINITVVDDTMFELDETIIVTISSPTNGVLGSNTQHTYTITDNDSAPSIQFSSTSSSGGEGTTPANLQLSLTNASYQNVSVDYSVTGGTATGSGTDYTLASGTATITAGNTTTNISATIVDDSLDESNETIIVTISDPNNATLGTNTQHTYTITDNDPSPTIQFTSTSSSGAEFVTPVNMELTLSAVSGRNVSVDYSVTGGTAIGSGTDYTLASGTATVTAGNTTTNISATIVDDSLDESNETIIVTISSPTNATLGTNTQYTYTIIDNDATPSIQFTIISSSGAESITPAYLQVSLSNGSNQDITVDYSVTGGTANGSGTDYTLASGTATVTAGNTTANISATIVDDSLDESNETIIVTISNPSNATLGTNTQHTYTITDNDSAPTIQFTSTSSSGGEGTTPVNLELTLSTASGRNVSVDYSVTGGTATGSGTDYTLASDTATITAGTTTTNISATIVDDSSAESNETIIVTISSPSNATLGDNTAHTYTIIDNDPSQLSINQQPSNTTAGSTISPAVTVRILDSNDNLVTSATDDVTIAIGNNPGSGTLSGTLTVAASSGVATFNDLSINKAGAGYSLTATSGSLTSATSDSFNITIGSASKLSLDQQPTNTTAGSTISAAVTVRILDANDNLVTSATDDVTIAIGNNPGSGTLSGTLTVAASSGVATFNDLSINKSGTGYTLTATSGSLTSDTSDSFNITVATANYFKVTGDASMTAGGSNELTVTAYDQYGNLATGYSGSKNLTFSGPSNAPDATAPTVEGTDVRSSTAVNFTTGVSDSGAATLAAYKAETATVDVTDGSIHSFTETSYDLDLTVNVASASTLSEVSGNNQSGTAGATLSNYFVVKITDTYENPVSGTTVSWSITTIPSFATGQSLSSSSTDSDSNGEASSQLTLGDKTGTYQVQASSAPLTGSPLTFSATANSATAQNIALVSGNCQTGNTSASLSNSFMVKVTDTNGNAVSGVSVSWTIAEAPPDASGQGLSSETVISDSNGEASVTLTLGNKAGLYRVEAAVSGLSGSPIKFSVITGTSYYLKGGSYRTFSVPYQVANGDAEAVLDELGSYDPGKWRLFQYVNGSYAEYPNIPDFSPGIGYWLIGTVNKDISTGGSAISSDVTVTLQPGWNQLACPFTCCVTWDDIKSSNAALFNSGTVADVLWDYDADQLEFSLSTQLDPWKFYWVYNSSGSSVDLIIPYQ